MTLYLDAGALVLPVAPEPALPGGSESAVVRAANGLAELPLRTMARQVCSGSFSPILNRPISMAYIPKSKKDAKLETKVQGPLGRRIVTAEEIHRRLSMISRFGVTVSF